MSKPNSLDGRQRIREAVTLATQEEYGEATRVIEEISKNTEMSRGAMVYLIHLLLAVGAVVTPTEDDFRKVLSHVFKVSAQDESSDGFM